MTPRESMALLAGAIFVGLVVGYFWHRRIEKRREQWVAETLRAHGDTPVTDTDADYFVFQAPGLATAVRWQNAVTELRREFDEINAYANGGA